MKIKELVKLLSNMPQNLEVVVMKNKYEYIEAEMVTTGYFSEQAGDFHQNDDDDDSQVNAVLISL